MDISVVIATRNRARSLENTLACLEKLETPGLTWELLVCDNGSSDGTQQVLRDYLGRLPLTIVTETKPGKNAALNAALPLIRGELTLFTDDDVQPARDWITEMAQAARRWPLISIFGGRVTPLFPREAPGWVEDPAYIGFAYANYNPQPREGPVFLLPFGPNYAVRTAVLATHRFDEGMGPNGTNYRIGGETEFLQRLVAEGHRAVYVPAAQVIHVIDPSQVTERWLFQRAYNLARGHVRLRYQGRPSISFSTCARMVKVAALYYIGRSGTDRQIRNGVAFHYLRGHLGELRNHT